MLRAWIAWMRRFRSPFGLRGRPASPPLAMLLILVGLLAALGPGTASAVELRDAALVASGSPVLQNGSGTVRLEDSGLGRPGPPVFVPEPAVLWQLGSGIGLLGLLAAHRRRRKPPARMPEQSDRANLAASWRPMPW